MSKAVVFFFLVAAPALSICLALLGLETLGSNWMGWILLVLGIAYPVGGVIHRFMHHKPFWKPAGGEVAREEMGDLSFWAILPGFLVVFFAPPVEWLFLPELLPRQAWMQVLGISLFGIAIFIRIWARMHIRGLYASHVEVHATHRLVQSGPYRFIRHPGYFGLLLFALGVAVAYSSLIGLVGICLLLLPGLAYRIKVEEKLLAEHFGEEFRQFSRKTRKLIPGIW